jgi:uncharacterized protein YceK
MKTTITILFLILFALSGCATTYGHVNKSVQLEKNLKWEKANKGKNL